MFIPNPNLANELEQEPEYNSALAEATEPAKEAAQSFAPVLSGRYKEGIKVVIVDHKVYLSGFDWKSNFIEHGTSDTPIFAPLRRGAQAAGLRFTEK